jgi:hypothetical protein
VSYRDDTQALLCRARELEALAARERAAAERAEAEVRKAEAELAEARALARRQRLRGWVGSGALDLALLALVAATALFGIWSGW